MIQALLFDTQGPYPDDYGEGSPEFVDDSIAAELPHSFSALMPMAFVAAAGMVCTMYPGGSNTGRNSQPRRGGRDPPSWNPDRESTYS